MNNTGDKFLVFSLNNTDYGIPLGSIKEIIELLEIVPIPQVPDFVKGVINLRGRIIPIIDLRQKFGFASMPYNDRTCIIILEASSIRQKNVGIIVDTVTEVRKIPGGDIEPVERSGINEGAQPILGVGKADGKVVLILNIEPIIDHSEQIYFKEESANGQV